MIGPVIAVTMTMIGTRKEEKKIILLIIPHLVLSSAVADDVMIAPSINICKLASKTKWI